MKGDTEVVAAVVIFIGGFSLGVAMNESNGISLIKDYLPSIATLFAAFVGARLAFAYHSAAEKEAEVRKNVEAGNTAIFGLIRSYNTFINYKSQFLTPHQDSPIGFIEISPSVGFRRPDSIVDFESLSFLFASNKPNILGELSLIEAEILSTTDAIIERSNLHLNHVQVRLEAAGIEEGGTYSLGQIEAALGARVSITLKNSTQQVIVGVDSIIERTDKLIEELNALLKELYKGHQIVKMQKLNKQLNSDTGADAPSPVR
jgi:hypothetical protein